MKIIRRIYNNFDRLYQVNKFLGIATAVMCHVWALVAVLAAINGNYARALDGLAVVIGFYLLQVFQMERNEARAELARLRADSRP